MKSINFRFIGHDYLLLDLCKTYFTSFPFIRCHTVLTPRTFLRSSQSKEADVVLLDLPYDRQDIYEYGIHLKRVFPEAMVIALAHRSDLNGVSNLQHINKLFYKIIERESAITELDKVISKLKKSFDVVSKQSPSLDFTSREKDVITLTCQEMQNRDIAVKLNISIRTVETHKSNIYVKLGSNNPVRLYSYAKDFGLI